MKKLLLLLFSLTLSFNSYGEWTEVWESEDGENIFIAFDRLVVKDEYVFSWIMSSNNKTSEQVYLQSDCDLIRMKTIQATSYDEPLGEGKGTKLKDEPWEYLAPESSGEFMVDLLCGLAKETPEEREKTIETITELVKGITNEDLLELEIAELKEAEAEILYRQLLAKEVQDEQDTARSQMIEDQLNMLQNAYINNIAARIKTFWRYQSAEDDWTAEVYVVQDRDGNVRAVDVKNANVGNSKLAKSFMDSIERAVNKASPFPRAPDDAVFDSEIYLFFSVN